MKNIIIILLILLSANYLCAMCIINPIEFKKIEGYVVYGSQERHSIIEKAEVLVYDQYEKQVIKSTAVDKNGYFKIESIKPGKYILSAKADLLEPAYVDIDIIASSKQKSNNEEQLILIVLGADTTTVCSGTWISIEDKSKIDAIIKSAIRPDI